MALSRKDTKVLVVGVLYTKLLFLIPLTLLIFIHTTVYPYWISIFNYSSPYFLETELVESQKLLASSLINREVLQTLTLTQRERIHAVDVINIARFIVLITFLIFFSLFLITEKKRIFISKKFRSLLSIFYISPLLIFAIVLVSFFDRFFLAIHTVLFTNDFWLLPREALLINIYPPQFFQHLLYILLTLSMIFYIVSIVISYLLSKFYEEKQ